MLVDCGFTGITKQGKGSQRLPAMIAPVENQPELMLSNMTQEIGFIESTKEEMKINFEMFPIGTILTLLPYHACASGNSSSSSCSSWGSVDIFVSSCLPQQILPSRQGGHH